MIRYLIAMALMGVVGLSQADVRGTVFGAAQDRDCSRDCADTDEREPYGGLAITLMDQGQGTGGFFEVGATYQGPYMGGGLLYRIGDFSVMAGPVGVVEHAEHDFGSGYGSDDSIGAGLGGLVEVNYSQFFARYTYYEVSLDFEEKRQVGTDANGDPIYDRRRADADFEVSDLRLGYRFTF